jgi:hypothetical protein
MLTIKSNLDPHMIIELKDGQQIEIWWSTNGFLKWFHLSAFDILLYLWLIGILGIHTY